MRPSRPRGRRPDARSRPVALRDRPLAPPEQAAQRPVERPTQLGAERRAERAAGRARRTDVDGRALSAANPGWGRFLRQHPRYAAIGLGQAAVFAFATDALFVPFLLVLGADPAFVSLLGVLPVVGSAAQVLLPRVLRRIHGDIGGLTVALTLVGETRGIWLAAVAAGWAGGVVPTPVAIGVVAVIGVAGGSVGLLAETTLLGWINVVLPDRERRLVLPRVMGLATGASAVLLVPSGLVLDGLAASSAGVAFAVLFGIAGVASLPLIAAVHGLPRPKPVQVHPDDARAARTPALRRFTAAALWNSVGLGFTPYVAVFVVAVHGLSPGFAVALSGLWSAVAFLASVGVGSFLAHGSASWVLRVAYLSRAVGLLALLAAFPGSPVVVPVLVASVALNSFGFNATAVAQNEQLFRLAGPAAIAHQGVFVAQNAATYTAAGMAGTALIAVAERVGFGAWALTFLLAGGARLVAARLTPVPPGWRSTSLVAVPSPAQPEPERSAA